MNTLHITSLTRITFFFFALWLCTTAVTYAQYEITIDALVIDQSTSKPLPYVNIGFIDKAVGTVSNEKGEFTLTYDESKITDTDVIQISSVGYQTIKLPAKGLYNLLSTTNKIYLKPEVEALEETVIYADKRITDTIGSKSYHSNLMAYWKDKKALGGEIGTFIKLRKNNSKLNQLRFFILENTADSLLVRVNVYNEKRKNPETNILTSNIYHTITTKKGEEIIDLSPYNIILNEDFIITLELIKVYGKDIQFAIRATQKGKAYLRYISQDAWQRTDRAGVAFKVVSSYSESENPEEERKKPDHIVLYWDTSLSMRNRDIAAEFDLLEEYFNEIKEATIDIIPFSTAIGKRHRIKIENGKSDQVFEILRALKTEGATDLSLLFDSLEDEPNLYIISTDGLYTIQDSETMYSTPVFYINSQNKANHFYLQESAQYSNGFYIDLTKVDPQQSLQYMLKDIVDKRIYSDSDAAILLKGKVTSMDTPIQGCRVSVKGTLKETQTNTEGEFTIPVEAGYVLVFEHLATYKEEVVVGAEKEISVALTPRYTTLDAVTLQGKSKEDKEIVDTGGQKVEKRSMGVASYTLDSEDFQESAVFLSDLIRTNFPGVRVNGVGDNATYVVRGNRSALLSSAPVFVVDGVPLQSNPNFINPKLIKSISLIGGLAGTARYGVQGAGGVFIIETKLAAARGDETKKKKSLLVTGNDYNEAVTLIDNIADRPEYLEKLWKSSSFNEALQLYNALKPAHLYQTSFYFDAAEYFTIWDKEFSYQILTNVIEIAGDNYRALRAAAFKLEEIEKFDTALLLYKRLMDIQPNSVQSYLDLARLYTINKDYKKAMDLYTIMLNNKIDGLDFTEVSELLESQLSNFLNNHRSTLEVQHIPKKYLSVKAEVARIVFDWNTPNASFELQFVSPQNKFFKWERDYEYAPEKIARELKYGILSKEFILDKSFKGEWIINVQSLDEEISELNPTYMKYTLYRNYGLPNEEKEVRFIKLYNQKNKVTLDKFLIQ